MDRIGLIEAILRRWWLLVLLGAVGVGLSYTSYTSTPKRYQSTVSPGTSSYATDAYSMTNSFTLGGSNESGDESDDNLPLMIVFA